jgi:hypothetical protein
MFAKTIIDSDAFLEMPTTSQLLYFHLAMRADDDGFVNKPKSLMRMVGCKDDDLKLLFVKKFLIPFESGVVVIKHWKIHNYIRKDTYTETKYKEEKATLVLDENSAYRLAGESPLQLRDETVTSPSTQDRLGKERIGKDRVGKKETTHELLLRLLPDYIIPEPLISKLEEWIAYKTERKETYKEVGLKSLLRQIENNQITYGASAVCDLIDDSMANGWKGIIFDRLKQRLPVRSNQQQKSRSFLDLVGDEV